MLLSKVALMRIALLWSIAFLIDVAICGSVSGLHTEDPTPEGWTDPCEEDPTPVSSSFDSSHALFSQVLSSNVKVDNSIGGITSNVVDYVALREDSSNLRAYMRQLCAVDLATLSPEEKVAMYCNAYNALMIAMIVHFDPPTSVLEISSMVPGGSVWKEKLGTVAGTRFHWMILNTLSCEMENLQRLMVKDSYMLALYVPLCPALTSRQKLSKEGPCRTNSRVQ
jgi:hypothetical protein